MSDTVARVAARRLADLIDAAREGSPVYRRAYRGLPSSDLTLTDLPVMHRASLMAEFDDWVTDRSVTLERVERFLRDRAHVGERLQGRYTLWKSSGSSGEPGIYVQDDEALAVYDALISVQLMRPDLAWGCARGVMSGGRAALVAAIGDHFASIASWQRVCRTAPDWAARGFSILEPIAKVVAELNDFNPAFLASYPTMLGILADERAAGRLRVAPSIVWSGGETLSLAAHHALESAFACPVVNEYGASECLSIACSCAYGSLHVNADWVIVEPVDAHYRPVARGEPSHTVLLTNLANRVQPIIRYDLGDSARWDEEPCQCGGPMPVLRVAGRCDEMLSLPGRDGMLRLLPLSLTTVIEEAAGIHRFQIVHDGRRTLRLRLPKHTKRAPAFRRAATALREFLDASGVESVSILLDDSGPQVDARSGKYRQVVVEPASPSRGDRSRAAARCA